MKVKWKKLEKVKEDLYVKKGIGNTYSVVYPMKDEEGNPIRGNLKRLFLSDLKASIPWLITVVVLLLMLLPGAQQLKTECEETIKELQDPVNACQICNNPDGSYNFKNNLTMLDVINLEENVG
jgi:hypothetical protein